MSAASGALLACRDDTGAHGAAHDHGGIEHRGGGVREIGPGRDHLSRLEPHLPARLAHRDDLALRLDEVAAVQRGEELDRLVRAEEPLVAVEPDEKLGGHVAEEAEYPGPVDQSAAVVRVMSGEPDAEDD